MPELPARPNLNQLRRLARELFRDAATGDPTAIDRIRAVWDRTTLSAAQLAIAREYGFASWSKLKAAVEQRQSPESVVISVSIPPEADTIMTDRARRIIVLAQEESRLLNHGFVGTEHLLLGLARDTEGFSAQVLAERGLSLDSIRQQVKEIIGTGTSEPMDSPPFTPRAKTVLELSLREALDLGDQHIAPEHILLGLVGEGKGVAKRILVLSGIDLDDLCRAVEERTGTTPRVPRIGGRIAAIERAPSVSFRGVSVPRRPSHRNVPQVAACSFCDRRPPASGRLVSGPSVGLAQGRIAICGHCVLELAEQWTAEDDADAPEEPHTNQREGEGDQPETAT